MSVSRDIKKRREERTRKTDENNDNDDDGIARRDCNDRPGEILWLNSSLIKDSSLRRKIKIKQHAHRERERERGRWKQGGGRRLLASIETRDT